MKLPVAILAGGLATRLRPLTEKIPKALIEINGEPFLAHQLRLLRANGVLKVVICAWYAGKMIRDYAGDGSQFGLEIVYSFDGEKALGTGGALRKALPLLGESFFVLYGDSYLPCDYKAIELAFLTGQRDGLMTIYHNRNAGDNSNVCYTDGNILVYDKKLRTPLMEHIDYGLGVFQARALECYQSGQAFDLAELYQYLLAAGQLAGYEVQERFYEIGSFEGIKELEKHLTEFDEMKKGDLQSGRLYR
jgi:N-acetyl-alpha-D-muramate 1-phosphate uridylyltransferase